jgi:long-chain fatty acid transport protein
MPQNKLILPAALLIGLASASAHATNGYFAHGYGTKNKGMGGGGVAFTQDAMAAGTNPAGMVLQDNRIDFGASVFRPFRSYEADTPTGFGGYGGGVGLVNGDGRNVDSGREEFLIPHLGINYMLDEKSSIGVSIYGNGGMNTYLEAKDTPGGFGTYGNAFFPARTAGVDLNQAFVTPTYSRKLSDTASYGISAVIAYQRFKAYGLQNYGPLSNDATKLTEKGYDDSWGLGAKIGFQAELTPGITLGAAYQSRIYMEELDKYKGLFAEQGDFDIPATATIGLAAELNKDTVLTFDIQHIWYSDIDSISNEISPAILNCMGGMADYCLGGDKGIGFGWDDMTIYKLGIQWQSSPDWTWRAGVSHAEMPFDKDELVFNIVAPAVVEDHITFGFTKKINKNNEINFAFMYAPEESLSGNPTGDQHIEIEMHQYELELSWGMTWN